MMWFTGTVLSLLALLSVAQLSCQPNNPRTDCGYYGITEQECEDKGCCWSPVQSEVSAPQDTPWCFYQTGPPAIYQIVSLVQTSTGYSAKLTINDTTSTQVQTLQADIIFESNDRFHLKIYDPSNNRWEIPESILPTPGVDPKVTPNYDFTYIKSPATFTLTRKSDGAVVLNATNIHFEDTYLSISTNLDAASGPNVYGIGEHVDPFKLATNTHSYTLWTADVATPPDQNLYGSHPFYMELRNGGNAHGIFLRSSNGMDIILSSNQSTFNVNGGILDLYVITGPTPTQVIQQYHTIIGRPYIPPYWSLGWHQCRYGYPNISYTENVVAQYKAANIPLETIWNDIDYMNAYEDFSWDPVNYPQAQVQSFVSQLHSQNQHYVVITDPGIHVRSGYPAYDSGISQGVFLMKADGVTPFVGQVWPGSTTFPDFFHPQAQSWWNSQFDTFLTGVPIDGIWIDMNEISNFQNGESEDTGKPGDVNNPTYQINNFNSHAPLNTKTTAMDCLHYGGIQEYNTHNMFGFLESIATHKMLVDFYNKRPFVLSRSTFSGSGAWTAHWLGDNQASWDSLYRSIPGILDMNMFGIPFVGADICGFQGSTTEELCARWSAMGAFYPFSRNHHDKSGDSQEPYNWPSVTQVAIKTLNARYSLLPYYYTLFYQASTIGGQVAQALLFQFPKDANTYSVDRQFLIGPALLITPVITQGATSVTGYFPAGTWYNFWDNTPMTSTGANFTLNAALTDIPVHVYGGYILPMQEPANTIAQTRANPFKLLVALDANNSSVGSMYIDDGISTPITQWSIVNFTASAGSLTSTVVQSSYGVTPTLNTITVLGVRSAPTSVTVNSAAVPYTYNSTAFYIAVQNLNLAILKPFQMTWK